MSKRNVWTLSRSCDSTDAHLLACPYCGEGQVRHVGSELARSLISLRFVCTSCEQPVSMHFELARQQTRTSWEWTR